MLTHIRCIPRKAFQSIPKLSQASAVVIGAAESFSAKGRVIKGVRRHARGRLGEVRYTYCHYFLKLEEGKPPKDFYKHNPLTPQQQLELWVEGMRKRKITNSF
ncbi:39S ribosomal protein L22, mitochondrial [Eumeta japonica]|uniref:39S ribosomal protein L22, mitochondrial n=1 Tax=Eumeta variegata TaxID=151549 RepID=A0A4C1XB05_EUMVA|nr:39S ribosomal protein L22, mitochondrial [Eumeta japonica]